MDIPKIQKKSIIEMKSFIKYNKQREKIQLSTRQDTGLQKVIHI